MTVANSGPAETKSKASIVVRNITKDFGAPEPAVKNLDLEIKDRELLVLLGPSGCGKTTTMHMLAGLETPTRGEIYFGERLMNRVPPEERDISMVFQGFGLYPHLNARENIIFPLKLAKVPAAVIQERLSEVTEFLGISQLLKRRLNELSGGERQRVALAKALVKRPRLFLLDEPFSSLDAEMRRQLRGELVRIHRQLETTMVFVTHDQEEAMAVADEVAVMRKGELVQKGDPLDLYNRPRNMWVARFVGSHPINLIACHPDEHSRKVHVFAHDGVAAEVPEQFFRTLCNQAAGRELVLGIRPEFIRIDLGEAGAGQLQAEVFIRQVLGNEILYELQVGANLLKAVVPSTQNYRVGTQVALSFEWSHVLTFDKATESCLLS